jgi:hypothetical protein
MRLTREAGDKKKKPAKEPHKKHREHVAAYMKSEMHQAISLNDLFHKNK